MKGKSSQSLKEAFTHLICNSVINFNLGIARPEISEKHWIYFPETNYPFYRLGFPHNFATSWHQRTAALYMVNFPILKNHLKLDQ